MGNSTSSPVTAMTEELLTWEAMWPFVSSGVQALRGARLAWMGAGEIGEHVLLLAVDD